MHHTYSTLLVGDFAMNSGATDLARHGFGNTCGEMLSLQKQTLALAKKQQSAEMDLGDEDPNDFDMPSGAPQPAEPQWVPLPLAMQGPAAVAQKLLTDAACTEEQIDAVALLALSMQKRFEARPDKTSPRLPVATLDNNHRAVWLGGGGVGKTHTLCKVVEPLAGTWL